MHKKLLVLFLFAFAITNAYGLECLLGCWYGPRVEQSEAGQFLHLPSEGSMVSRYENDIRTSRASLARIPILKNALPVHFAHGLVEVIDDYLWTSRCYITHVHEEENGVCSAMTIQDQDGTRHGYIVLGSSHGRSFPLTCKMELMTQKQMRDIVALRQIQNKPSPANAREQEAENATLAVLQERHQIAKAMIALVMKRQLVTVPGEW